MTVSGKEEDLATTPLEVSRPLSAPATVASSMHQNEDRDCESPPSH